MSITTDIPCKFDNRQWMRSAKAWRCFFALPENQTLASALTALIDRKVKASIIAPDGLNQTIEPVIVVDVPKKGRHYQLVIETCYEQQREHGPYLTAMAGQMVRVSLDKYEENTTTPQQVSSQGKVGAVQITGLHSTFFKNPKFHRFVALRSQKPVSDERSCKEAFKAFHNIDSTKDLDMTAFRDFLKDFNTWINGGVSA